MTYGESVVTGEAVEIALPIAGIASRGVAAVIDYAVTTVAMIALLFLVFAASSAASLTAVLTEVLVIVVLVQLGYPVAVETLWRGKTLGKAAMGLRVVRDDGGPILFRHAFVRGLVGVFLDKPGISYGMLALFPMLLSKQSKRLGDMAAGTLVLQERVPARVDPPIPMPPPLAGWAAALDLSRIDDAVATRMRQFLNRAGQLHPATRDAMERSLVTEVTSRLGVTPPPAPGWAVLAAVLAERRNRAFVAMQSGYFPGTPVRPPDPVEPPSTGFAPPS